MSSPPTPPESSASSLNEDAPQNNTGKLKTFIGILKRFVGVADLAAVRFSLPSQLLEPRPNLEYWTYLDVPSAFTAIGEADDPVDRMLEVCRFWFTKDLKYIKGRPCKPYNSCLGEFFRCNWEVEDNAPRINTRSNIVANGYASGTTSGTISSASSVKSVKVDTRTASSVSVLPQSEKPAGPTTRISYLTEQTSHHPPVSAFFIACPEKGLHARGFDQITAKFTGTAIKVAPGEHNYGIFITLEKRDNERYQLKHPAASLDGIFRGALNVSVGEAAYITCPKTKLKCILEYAPDPWWVTASSNNMEGAIFRYDPDQDDKLKIKDVPEADILVRLDGKWKGKIYYTIGPKPFVSYISLSVLLHMELTQEQKLQPEEKKTVIIDVNPLIVSAKSIPPVEEQAENESLTLWNGVTQAILSKQFSKATNVKIELEERQREKAKERESKNEPFQPAFFTEALDKSGMPQLNDHGREVLKRLQNGDWSLKGLI